jgi:Restriction endonuclease
MAKPSIEFEQRIERIHRLLEAEATVKWNDRFPDPDNPSRPRQVDITIRRGDSLTIVECRLHSAPQDVKWIEELIGRRASLRADAVIAVSASGFTEGAEAKATQFGIILRDMDTLTAEEVRDWGKKRNVKAIFYQFTQNVLSVTLPIVPPRRPVMLDPTGAPFDWSPVLKTLMRKLADDRSLDNTNAAIPCVLEVKAQCTFSGMKASQIMLSSMVRRIVRDIRTASLVAYADPLDNNARQALIGNLDFGKSEMLEISDTVSVVIDISQIKIPKASLFNAVLFDMGRRVQMKEFRILGGPNARLGSENFIAFDFRLPSETPLIPTLKI